LVYVAPRTLAKFRVGVLLVPLFGPFLYRVMYNAQRYKDYLKDNAKESITTNLLSSCLSCVMKPTREPSAPSIYLPTGWLMAELIGNLAGKACAIFEDAAFAAPR
jgi:hypothetical protein